MIRNFGQLAALRILNGEDSFFRHFIGLSILLHRRWVKYISIRQIGFGFGDIVGAWKQEKIELRKIFIFFDLNLMADFIF
ncbi:MULTISPECIES: hypothetical protein [Burkholderia]|uniref:hypothetical protein n=1 Tax=Burkholderia TaxID=32008 RepID=UPI0015E0AB37|nr:MULTISPECIES: hypothetical protein [unclassified Burkholderia]